MRKRFFNWTPNDIAQWEAIRRKGLRSFVLWYGIVIFGGILFIALGGVTVLASIKEFMQDEAALPTALGGQVAFLGLELLFIATLCAVGGIVNSLVTWAMEESVYRKLMRGEGKNVKRD